MALMVANCLHCILACSSDRELFKVKKLCPCKVRGTWQYNIVANNQKKITKENKKEVEKERKWLIELSKWSNSENIDMLEKAKKRIQKQSTKLVLDCFAGGGSIPLEMLRLGCETYAVDYNPVVNQNP